MELWVDASNTKQLFEDRALQCFTLSWPKLQSLPFCHPRCFLCCTYLSCLHNKHEVVLLTSWQVKCRWKLCAEEQNHGVFSTFWSPDWMEFDIKYCKCFDNRWIYQLFPRLNDLSFGAIIYCMNYIIIYYFIIIYCYYSSFAVIKDKENQQILTFEELEPVNV